MIKLFSYFTFILLLGFVLVIFLTYSYDKDITLPSNVTGEHIDVDGVKLRVDQFGQGPDILFLHGSIGNLEDFEALLPYLKNHRVTLFDRIGHGYSAMSPLNANIKNNALSASALIKKLKLKNVTVVGHSYGGSIALKMALNKDPNIRSLVLLAPAAYSLSPTSKLEHLLAKPVIGLGLIRLLQPFIAEQRLENGLSFSITPNQPIMPTNFIQNRLKLWNNPGILYTRTQQTNEVTSELIAMQAHYQDIKLPVSILIGDKENHQDISQGCRLLEKDIKHSKLLEIKDAGHYLQYKDPVLIGETIKSMSY